MGLPVASRCWMALRGASNVAWLEATAAVKDQSIDNCLIV
jgi:hypothetical protein